MTKRSIKIKNKLIRYNYHGMQMAREVVAIEKFIRGAYELAEESLKQIKSEDCKPYFGAIFGSIDEFTKKHVSDAYVSIIKKIESGLNIIRANKFVSKERKFEADTFSSADPKDGRTIRIYDAFFLEHKDDAKNLNDRSSVILHEVAHLVGLTGDVETNSVKSAECLRNFTLLACEIVSPQDLFSPNGSNEPEKSKDSQIGMLGDLPYDPSQPRAPRGTSIGGQWIKVIAQGADEAAIGKAGNALNKLKSALGLGKRMQSVSRENEQQKNTNAAKIRASDHNADPRRPYHSKDLSPGDFKQGFENGYPSVWGALDIKVDGLEPGKRNTVLVKVEYEYSKIDETGETIRAKESVVAAYDVIANHKGEAYIARAGLINAITKQDKIEEGDIDITVNISTRKGSPAENYPGNIEKVEWTTYSEPEARPITDYAATHPSTGAYATASTPRDEKGRVSTTGGKIKNYTPSSEEKSVYSSKVKITLNGENARKGGYR